MLLNEYVTYNHQEYLEVILFTFFKIFSVKINSEAVLKHIQFLISEIYLTLIHIFSTINVSLVCLPKRVI